MVKACVYSREADTTYGRQFVMRRATANRDQAAIFTLLDSSVRASELCAFWIGGFDPKRGKLEIRHGVEGGPKGGVFGQDGQACTIAIRNRGPMVENSAT
jgi:integrase/recombinase XerD